MTAVLVVDDDTLFGCLVGDVLRARGVSSVQVENGLEALKYLAEGELPKVIILDSQMRRMCGREFLKRKKLQPILREIPVIFCTGDDEIKPSADHMDVIGIFEKEEFIKAIEAAVKVVKGSYFKGDEAFEARI